MLLAAIDWTDVLVALLGAGGLVGAGLVASIPARKTQNIMKGDGNGRQSVVKQIAEVHEQVAAIAEIQKGSSARLEKVERVADRLMDGQQRLDVRMEASLGWQMAHEVGHERDRAYQQARDPDSRTRTTDQGDNK